MRQFFAVALLGSMMAMVGCGTAPKDEAGREKLHDKVNSALSDMKSEDSSFPAFLDKAYAYAIFPTVGKGGLGVGGSWGRGEVYQGGAMIGYSDMSQVTVGLQIGGQAFTQVIAFENKTALDKFKNDNYQFAAQASAVALKSGAAANAKYTDGVAIFTHIKGGLMAEASVGGQRFRYTAK